MTAAIAQGKDDIARPAMPFDPTAALFVAQRDRPPRLEPVDLHALSPFQRGLLVIDGTVTSFIEAYAFEPIEVQRLGQADVRLAAADRWLDLPAGAPVIRRRVMLRGTRTGRFFVWADSLIASERIAPALQDALHAQGGQGGGLGRILLHAQAETRRQGLWYGREHRDDTPPEVSAIWQGDFLTRAYRVLAAARPMMLITERFAL